MNIKHWCAGINPQTVSRNQCIVMINIMCRKNIMCGSVWSGGQHVRCPGVACALEMFKRMDVSRTSVRAVPEETHCESSTQRNFVGIRGTNFNDSVILDAVRPTVASLEWGLNEVWMRSPIFKLRPDWGLNDVWFRSDLEGGGGTLEYYKMHDLSYASTCRGDA